MKHWVTDLGMVEEIKLLSGPEVHPDLGALAGRYLPKMRK